MPKPKKRNKRALVKKLDKVFSVWIRSRGSINGMNECYTCGSVRPLKQLQCGHFISRTYYTTRWEPDNCRPQCISCNMYNQGQQYLFGKKLEIELGAGRVEQLQEIKSQPSFFSLTDYQEMIEFYGS
jgi:5-methylcytosine-specific restriction endonuclease McrA